MSTRDQPGGGAPKPVARKRRGPHLLSTLLFLTAVAFAAVAGYLYWNEQQDEKNEPTPPPAESGAYDLAQVKGALDNAGLKSELGRTTGDTDQIPGAVGQPIILNESKVEIYVYIFSPNKDREDPIAMAEEAFTNVDESTLVLTRRSGEVIGEGEVVHAFQGSNIIAVMVGGEDADVEQARTTIEGLK